MFGRLMSISDELMVRYASLPSVGLRDLAADRQRQHPSDGGQEGALPRVGGCFHGEGEAEQAQRFSNSVFRSAPHDPEVLDIDADDGGLRLFALIVRAGFGIQQRGSTPRGAAPSGSTSRWRKIPTRASLPGDFASVGRRRMARIRLSSSGLAR